MAQLFSRLGNAIHTGESFEPDCAHAVRPDDLLVAIERASEEGRRIALTE